MKIIDAHIHFSNIESFKKTATDISFLDYSSKGLGNEFDNSNIILGVGMGVTETSSGGFPDNESSNPMNLDLENELPKFIAECVGINPIKLIEDEENELINIENYLRKEYVVGIKIYAGYYHYHVWDNVYNDVYKLAQKYDLPVVIHCGDTYSERGLLKYSHPLNVDELAFKYRDVNFIISHFGDPWIMETAEVISKNSNVYADLSGLIVGEENKVNRFKNERLFVDHIKRGLVYADNYSKIIFGSDWPLVKIEPYIDFIKYLVKEEYHEDVFYNNALRVFKRLSNFIKE